MQVKICPNLFIDETSLIVGYLTFLPSEIHGGITISGNPHYCQVKLVPSILYRTNVIAIRSTYITYTYM
jgi:hypothetical protein